MFICGSCQAAFGTALECWTHVEECEGVARDWEYSISQGILEVVN